MTNEEYKKEKKFFTRFLKEKGLYIAYFKYIYNPKTENCQNAKNFSFEKYAKKNGFKRIISHLITWDKTKEGYDFWNNVYLEFKEKYKHRFEEFSAKIITIE